MDAKLKEKLLKLQESDFVADDIKLYLDTHPHDTAMLMKLCMQNQKSMMLRNEIEGRYCYPLTASAASNYGPCFKWIDAPWPWCPEWPGESKCNTVSLEDCNKNSCQNNENDCVCKSEMEGCK